MLAALMGAAAAGTVHMPLGFAGVRPRRARACIVLFMHGGPSQIDTWDPKPGRETGGPFAGIRTRIPGVHVSEHLPRLAARLDRVALIRSLTGAEGNHERARYLMHTGYAPAGATRHPSLGALIAAERPGGDLPPHVAIGARGHDAGFLGAQLGPYVIPNAERPARSLRPARPVSAARAHDRAGLWRALESDFGAEHHDPFVHAHTEIVEQTIAMMSSDAMEAFDLTHEPARVQDDYGRTRFGRGCLMARRLVEAGVPFVEVALRGWDTHADAFDEIAALSSELDAAMSTLLDDLEARGLLDETLVVCMGEFGRTARINARGGRDHEPKVASALLAGAGVPGGAVIGRTDRDGARIVDDPITVPDLMRTITVRMGIDPDRTRVTPGGRPLSAVDGGQVIRGLA